MLNGLILRIVTPILLLLLSITSGAASPADVFITEKDAQSVIGTLVDSHGPDYRDRIESGVAQVQQQWTAEDGEVEEFRTFCLDNFISDQEELKRAFQRLESALETINGHLTELGREMSWNLDVNTGPLLPIDHLLGNLSLDSHLSDDLYTIKIAFWVLLNYPVYSLDDCLAMGDEWSRQKWAEVRLAQRFSARVPAAVNQAIHDAFVRADNYISNYNIYMNHLLTEDGRRLFPEGLRLITHWGLRDELKAQYAMKGGFERQQMIYDVMLNIISQKIPRAVIDNPNVDWIVSTNKIQGETTDNFPEPDTRYDHLGNYYRKVKQADPYYPVYPNFIDRSFNLSREIPETTVRQLFTRLLSSKEFRQSGKVIKQQLGRDLEPFDIWYNGFRYQSAPDQQTLDKITLERYPTAEAFREDLPNILGFLGFDQATAEFLQTKIEVDPARGVGHAMGAGRRSDNAHLRTRVSEEGMTYKGYNIAIHELGHNVEQVFSLNRIDHTLLEGVPNTAFTEAFAFVFQSRDLDILGVESAAESNPYEALHRLWSVCEIAAVALVDMEVWHWMYDHPGFTSAELKTAVMDIAKEIWNEYYYPVTGKKDSPILAIYSHMIDYGLYLPNYPLGHIIEFQIEEYMEGKNLGKEMERMCRIGCVIPNQWMQEAMGEPISVEPIIAAARKSLKSLK